MVSWIRMYSDASGHPGSVNGYGRIATANPLAARRALWSAITGPVLSSPGTVDTNSPTRSQYVTVLGLPLWQARGAFRIDAGDVAAYPGLNFTASMFIAPASAFADGVVPTPDLIRLNAVTVVRGDGQFNGATVSPDSRTDAGDLNLLVFSTTPQIAEEPNKKYWVLVAPTVVASMASTPSITNDQPLGNVNINGRAVSLWTNRTPLAPVITAPTGQATIFAGAQINFAFSPRDPDRISSFKGDSGINDFEDVAGVQIQYAPAPTTDEPTPEWSDLPIADSTGTTFGAGWWIDDTTVLASTSGSKNFWHTFKLAIRCGSVDALAPNAAYLPSGKWQIRVRTFDYGHGWSDSDNVTVSPPGQPGEPPLADVTRNVTPDTYPAANTSPWSTPITVLISEQVPKPLALSPVNNIAHVEGTPVSLVWQYRNTYTPPYPQEHRTVQIRQLGESGWTTLVDEDSASSSLVVSGYDFVSGNAYQWRVRVTDSSGVLSAYSDPATFWIVPVPDSGGVIPEPGTMIDGATLGCGKHRVEVYRRGGKVKVAELTGVSYVKWGRVRDDTSKAKVIINKWDESYGELLANLKTWAHEVRIYRDNAFSVAQVWEGPITLLTYKTNSVVIDAKDISVYPYRRIVKQIMNDFGTSPTVGDKVTLRAARVMQNVMAPDDPNVLAYLTVVENDDDAKQYRSLPAYSKTAFEEIDDMAANAGLDYTVVGRRMILWSTKHRIGTLPEFRDKDLGDAPIVSEYGMSAANVYAVSDGNGVYGVADRLNDEDEDPIYGLIEVLSSTWASDSDSDTGSYTQEGLATISESFAESAERSIASKYPPPVVVRVPDNTRLSPDVVLDIQHLVPGVVIPLRSVATLRHVVASQKLDSVTVIEEKGVETITVTMSPFSRDDRAPEDGEVEG